MTRLRNFSFRNSKAAFVQCSGAPSCIQQSEERLAEWRSLDQIMSCSKECMNDWNHSINNGNEDQYLNIISIICFADISRIFICPHSVVFSMRFLMEAKNVCKNVVKRAPLCLNSRLLTNHLCYVV